MFLLLKPHVIVGLTWQFSTYIHTQFDSTMVPVTSWFNKVKIMLCSWCCGQPTYLDHHHWGYLETVLLCLTGTQMYSSLCEATWSHESVQQFLLCMSPWFHSASASLAFFFGLPPSFQSGSIGCNAKHGLTTSNGAHCVINLSACSTMAPSEFLPIFQKLFWFWGLNWYSFCHWYAACTWNLH